jgi:hypothetical protein
MKRSIETGKSPVIRFEAECFHYSNKGGNEMKGGIKDLHAYRCGFLDGFNGSDTAKSQHYDSISYRKGYKSGVKTFKKQIGI